MRAAALTALAIIVLSAATTARASGGDLTLSLFSTYLSPEVEQQSDYPYSPSNAHYVINNTGCPWAIDDNSTAYGTGSLRPGATVTYPMCEVSDASAYYICESGQCAYWSYWQTSFAIDVHAPAPGLAVSACYQAQGRCFAANVTANADGTYEYTSCSQAVYTGGDPALRPIPNSGTGGTGVLDTVVVSIGNPTAHAVSKITATAGVVNSGNGNQSPHNPNAGCPPGGANQAPNSAYPWHWW